MVHVYQESVSSIFVTWNWGKIVIKKLTISIDLPTPFEASLSRPGSKLRIQIASR